MGRVGGAWGNCCQSISRAKASGRQLSVMADAAEVSVGGTEITEQYLLHYRAVDVCGAVTDTVWMRPCGCRGAPGKGS